MLLTLIILITFWVIAIVLWQAKDNIFFLYNFGYIGTAIGLGIGLYIMLPRKSKPNGRRLAQFLVGIYMLGFLGLLKQENMQLEGFFFYREIEVVWKAFLFLCCMFSLNAVFLMFLILIFQRELTSLARFFGLI